MYNVMSVPQFGTNSKVLARSMVNYTSYNPLMVNNNFQLSATLLNWAQITV
jgi:hypothetical protein